LALQWGDVDFNGRFITVRRNLYRGRIQTPKNGTGRRVDMSRQLTDVLRWHLTERKKEALRKGWGEVPDWLFTTDEGELISADHWRRQVFHKVLRKAGLRSIRIHDLRHTYATHLIQNGTSLVYIRDQLGHHSISITVDTYGHLVPGENQGMVDALDDATGRNLSATWI
jgi:integrase